jgi:hypothetical protein
VGRILDSRGRILGKLNIVDLLVVLVVIAIVVFAFVRFGGSSGVQTVQVRVTYVVDRVGVPVVAQLKQAQGSIRDDAGSVLGRLESVADEASIEEVATATGQLVQSTSPIFRDARLVVVGSATRSNGTYRIGSVPLQVGNRLYVLGSGFKVQALVEHVEEVK